MTPYDEGLALGRKLCSIAVDTQPTPLQEPVGVDIGELVISDLRERIEYGRGKYGVSLHSHDGRDTLVDLVQELYDAIFYLRKLIEERGECGCDNPKKFLRFTEACAGESRQVPMDDIKTLEISVNPSPLVALELTINGVLFLATDYEFV